MEERTKVAIVGLGNIGTGVAQLLLDNGDRTARHAGRTLWLEAVVVRDVNAPRQVDVPAGILTDNLTRVTNNPEIRVVAELIGGIEPARTIVLKLLESGKDIVTANKALLAEHGPELFDRARELGRSIAFEASVMGGVPIITNISQCLSANQITSLQAIVNGTSNFILSAMDDRGLAYADAVNEAQHRGLAEANPAMDVDGTDAAQKLAILAHLAFGARAHWKDIPRTGIDKLDAADMRYARELGYRIKLVAVARLIDGGLELHVSPTLVRVGRPLAEVREAFNAIRVVGDFVGPVFFHGLGAGRMPTASAVVADMIDTAVGRTRITFRTLEPWSNRDSGIVIRDHAKLPARYYLRFTAEDHPNVLSQITGALGRHQISIASVIQHEPQEDGEGGTVPLVMMTHQTTEGATEAAVQEIDRLACVRPDSVRMQVLDD
jgi:homoserine dehydrogenase